jgi:hypothetical protein
MIPVSLGAVFEAASRLTAAPAASAEVLEVRVGETVEEIQPGAAGETKTTVRAGITLEFQVAVNPWRASEIVWSWRGAIAVDEALVADAAAQPLDRASEPGPTGLSRAIEQQSGGQCEPGAVRVLSWDDATSVAIVLALFRPR